MVDRRSKRSLVANDGLSESYLELIFTLAVTFVVVPMLINFALCIMLVKRESQNDQVCMDTYALSRSTLFVFFLSRRLVRLLAHSYLFTKGN